MKRSAYMSRGLPATLLIITVSARLVFSISNNANDTSFPSIDSSHLKLEARNDNEDINIGISPKATSEILLNGEYSLKVKTDDQKNPSSNSIISSRNNIQSRKEDKNGRIIASPKDSYLDALQYSQNTKAPYRFESHSQKYPKVDYNPGPVYRGENSNSNSNNNNSFNHNNKPVPALEPKVSRISYNGITYDVPADSYVLPSVIPSYGTPEQVSYGTPGQVSYGTPEQVSYGTAEQVPYGTHYVNYDSHDGYGVPNKNYKLVPLQTYGAPSYSSSNGPPYLAYGTPQQGLGSLQATYSTSHPLPDFFPLTFLPAIDFSWPISLKIDAFTLIKIFLKLFVFKMIIKFIAVICLLIFIPKLIFKKHKHDVDDLSRKFPETSNFPAEQLNLLRSIVLKSIEHYNSMNTNDKKHKKSCTDLACQITEKLFNSDETWKDYSRVFKAYVEEEQSVQKQSKGNRVRRK